MSNYPEWWDSTITVFNKYEDPTTKQITWYKHTIKKCFWKYTGNTAKLGETIIETNTSICRVPVSGRFKEKYLWDELASAKKSNFFTFGIGDILVKGAVTDTINEYEAGKRSSDLINKYKKLQGCFKVENCAINVGPGRELEHYYVRGV